MIVKVFANLRDICNSDKVEVNLDGDKVIDVLNTLIDMFPDLKDEIFTEEKQLKQFVHVFVNGRNIVHDQGLETKVKPDDQFALFPPVAGG